nr:unnamed protein product [Naegleria fowleri]
MSLIEPSATASLSIEDICLNLDKLKKDYELTTKACTKATKDKARLVSLLEQHQIDIQQAKQFIEQQIQHRAHLEQRINELEWKFKMKEHVRNHVRCTCKDEEKLTEETCSRCDVSLDQMALKLQEYNTKLQRANQMKQTLKEEAISLRNTFSELTERKKSMEQRLNECTEHTTQMQDTLYDLDEQLSAIMKANTEKMKDLHRESMDKSLLAEQQRCNEQTKAINLELRDLRQRKHNLSQQLESKRKLRDALQDELQHLSQEIAQNRKPSEKSLASDDLNVLTSSNNTVTNPFSAHFASSSNKLEPRRQFTFKKQVKNGANSAGVNTSLAPTISPVTPDVRLLKRKTSFHDQAPQNTFESEGTPKKNEFKTAKEILQSKSSYLSSGRTPQVASPSTYTFKKMKKD